MYSAKHKSCGSSGPSGKQTPSRTIFAHLSAARCHTAINGAGIISGQSSVHVNPVVVAAAVVGDGVVVAVVGVVVAVVGGGGAVVVAGFVVDVVVKVVVVAVTVLLQHASRATGSLQRIPGPTNTPPAPAQHSASRSSRQLATSSVCENGKMPRLTVAHAAPRQHAPGQSAPRSFSRHSCVHGACVVELQ